MEKHTETTIMGYTEHILGESRIISIPNLRPFKHHSLCKPPFRVRSGEVSLHCPELLLLIFPKGPCSYMVDTWALK